jgi:hypothetical protein
MRRPGYGNGTEFIPYTAEWARDNTTLGHDMKTAGICIFCTYGSALFKLRRRWVHHFPDTGKLIACEARNLKPRSTA